MKALVLALPYRGKEVEVLQWCNDWFMVDGRNIPGLSEAQQKDLSRRPLSPTALAFTHQDFRTIQKHDKNGQLFVWFAPRELRGVLGAYEMTFTDLRVRKPLRPDQLKKRL